MAMLKKVTKAGTNVQYELMLSEGKFFNVNFQEGIDAVYNVAYKAEKGVLSNREVRLVPCKVDSVVTTDTGDIHEELLGVDGYALWIERFPDELK